MPNDNRQMREYTELHDLSAIGHPEDEPQQQPKQGRLVLLFSDPAFRQHLLLSTLYILLWYTFSGMLSVYNKWLYGAKQRDFSFPLLVSAIQMGVQFLLAALTLRIFTHLQPLHAPSWSMYLTRAVPCGIASALDIGLSNVSLQTITLTFYTMCKSSNLGFVLLFAFVFGLERPRLALILIIAVISLGVVLMVAGEVDFVLIGFIEAMTSSAMGGLRWSLVQVLLSQARFGMNNPVATLYKLTPVMGLSMLVLSLLTEHPLTQLTGNKNLQTSKDILFILFMIMVGGVMAFAMVLSEFFLISRTSVVTLSIAGMLKEVLMVGVAHSVFGDRMTWVNAAGLVVALVGIGLYNWLKIQDTLRASELDKPPQVETLE